MITADQLIAHAIGDYLLQSDWAASGKTKKYAPLVTHVVLYTLPFFYFTRNWRTLLLIMVSHAVIDGWRLARYVCWVKNFLAPSVTYEIDDTGPTRHLVNATRWWHPWAECVGTGYHKDKPAWLAFWLLIITDNVMHVLCNGIALQLWG